MEFLFNNFCQIIVCSTFFIIFLVYIYYSLPNLGFAERFDRTFSTKAKNQALWLLGAIVLTFLIMLVGAVMLNIQDSFIPTDETFNDGSQTIEYVIALMLDPGQLDHLKQGDAHWGGLVLAFLGIITITGFTISTITNMVQRRVNSYLNGEVRYRNIKDHFVIIGYGPLAITIIEELLSRYGNNHRILLMSSDDAKEIRGEINTVIEKKYEKNITIYRGRKKTQEDIDSLNISSAREVFLIGEKAEINRDASNVESLQVIIKSIKAAGVISKKIPITVLFEFQTTFAAFQIIDISREWQKYIDFRPFNYYENWAKKLLYTRSYKESNLEGEGNNNKKEINYPSLDREPITEDSSKHVHFVIFSMSRMGVALGTFAAQICHFPNFATKGIKTRITFITPEADTEANFFRGRYSRFFEVAPSIYRDFYNGNGKEDLIKPLYPEKVNWLDIEFEFIKGKAEQPEIRALLSKWAQDDNQVLTIAICQRDPSKNMAIGLYLPDIIYENQIPVFIRQKSSGTLLSQLRSNIVDTSYHRFSKVYPFGMQDNCFDLENEDIAKAQLFNSFYYDIYNKKFEIKELIEELNKKWQGLSISLKWSNLYSVYSVKYKLNSLIPYDKNTDYTKYTSLLKCKKNDQCQFTEIGDKTELMAEVEHNRWNVEKLLLGYRVYNDTERDDDKKLIDELEDLMGKYDLTYADLEYGKKHMPDSVINKYKQLNEERKKNKNGKFAHNALLPYKDLDEGNKRYDRFMTGNIPNLLLLYSKIEEYEKIHSKPN